MWLQTGLCGCLYKKIKPYFTNNGASAIMRTLTDLRVTVAIETKSHIECTLWSSFLKGFLLDYICLVTIKTKTQSNPHRGFFLNEASDWAIFSSNHRNKALSNAHCSFFFKATSDWDDLLQ